MTDDQYIKLRHIQTYCRLSRNNEDRWNCPSSKMQQSGFSVPTIIAEEAYKEYADQGHGGQSFARLQERGGFSAEEIAMLLYDRIKRLELTTYINQK